MNEGCKHRNGTDWDSLPMLLSRSVVAEWTGLSNATLSELVSAGRLQLWRTRPDSRKGKFYKAEVAKLVHMNPAAPGVANP